MHPSRHIICGPSVRPVHSQSKEGTCKSGQLARMLPPGHSPPWSHLQTIAKLMRTSAEIGTSQPPLMTQTLHALVLVLSCLLLVVALFFGHPSSKPFPFPLTSVHTSPPSLIHHTSSYTLRSSDTLLIPVQTPLANSALLNKCVQNVGSFHIPPTYVHSMVIHALV